MVREKAAGKRDVYLSPPGSGLSSVLVARIARWAGQGLLAVRFALRHRHRRRGLLRLPVEEVPEALSAPFLEALLSAAPVLVTHCVLTSSTVGLP
jgi:predicted alpha/beta-hydrolase family hydrolase